MSHEYVDTYECQCCGKKIAHTSYYEVSRLCYELGCCRECLKQILAPMLVVLKEQKAEFGAQNT